MKTCNKCGEAKPLDAFSKRKASLDGLQTACKDCASLYYAANKSAYHKRSTSWRKNNIERSRAFEKSWREKNPAKVIAKVRGRDAKKSSATPKWADHRAIEQYYMFARFFQDQFGVKYNVDHIVPLKNDLVCGLHAPANLTFMPAAWNIAKSNKIWPDMP